jgi:hypothetical protein
MAQHLVIAVDSNGTSVVYVPMFRLWEFLRLLPPELAAISYHYPTGQAQVSFPGLGLALAQRIVDAALMKDDGASSPDGSF